MNEFDKIDTARKHDITLQEVRSVPMFAHFTDEQAMEVVESFKQLSHIIFEYYQNGKIKKAKNS